MNRYKLILLFNLVIIGNLGAQIAKSSFIIEENLSISIKSAKIEHTGTTVERLNKERKFISITNLGYSISDKDVLGVSIGYGINMINSDSDFLQTNPSTGFTSVQSNNQVDEKYISALFGLFYRRYIQVSGKFYFVPGIELNHEGQTYKNDRIVYQFTQNGTNEIYAEERKVKSKYFTVGLTSC